MKACPTCGTLTPPIYFAGGQCFDCCCGGPEGEKGATPPAMTPAKPSPAWTTFSTIASDAPASFARAMAMLTPAEGRAVFGVICGQGVRAIARDIGKSAPTVCLALGRAVEHFRRLGLIGANTLKPAGENL